MVESHFNVTLLPWMNGENISSKKDPCRQNALLTKSRITMAVRWSTQMLIFQPIILCMSKTEKHIHLLVHSVVTNLTTKDLFVLLTILSLVRRYIGKHGPMKDFLTNFNGHTQTNVGHILKSYEENCGIDTDIRPGKAVSGRKIPKKDLAYETESFS